MHRVALIAVVALLAAAGGYFAAMQFAGPAASPVSAAPSAPAAPVELVGQRRPDFAHRDPSGRTWTADDFDSIDIFQRQILHVP